MMLTIDESIPVMRCMAGKKWAELHGVFLLDFISN